MADQLLTGTTLIEDKRREFGGVWSCPGVHFNGLEPDVDDISMEIDGHVDVDQAGGINLFASVLLPHGATITSVIVYSSSGTETYTFRRVTIDGGAAATIGTATCNSADITLNNEEVDNNSYAYFIYVADVGNTNSVYGARVKYE